MAKKREKRPGDPQGRLIPLTYKERTATPIGHRRALVDRARRRAKLKGLEVTITYLDIIIPTHCPVLGIKLKQQTGITGPCDSSPTLDRIDNNKGYVRGNIEVISWKANRIKCDATVEELRKVADYYGKKERKSTSSKDTSSHSKKL